MKTDWIKGKSLKTITRKFRDARWETFLNEENGILEASLICAGVVIDAMEIHFSEKLRATEAIYIVKGGKYND